MWSDMSVILAAVEGRRELRSTKKDAEMESVGETLRWS